MISTTLSKDVTLQHKHQADIATSLMMSMLTLGRENRPVTFSKLITVANNAIPEWYPGEHEETAQNMLAGPSVKSTPECLKVMVYMMANSILVPDKGHLDFIFSLLGTGFIDIRADLKRLQNENPTIRAFLERLFQSTIQEATASYHSGISRSKYLNYLTLLLEMGIYANRYCDIPFPRTPVLATPIQQAVGAGLLDVVRLLLRFHAGADLPQRGANEISYVNLVLEIDSPDAGILRMLNLLFDHELLSNDEMLRGAIELEDTELMLQILQYDPDVTSYETTWLDPACRQQQNHGLAYLADSSALMMAVQTGGRMADSMLDYLFLRGQPTSAVLADAYIAAAYGGHYSIILRLEELHNSGIICNRKGITPLQAAVFGGDLRVCKLLLERYGGASTLLLLVAAEFENTVILQLLIDYGGNPNNPVCRADSSLYRYLDKPFPVSNFSSSILSILINGDFMEESILTLLQNGARLSPGDIAGLSQRRLHRCLEAALAVGGNPNDKDTNNRYALQCALDEWRLIRDHGQNSGAFVSAKLLIERGAKLNGGEVVRAIDLRSQDLILYLLQHGGILTDVDGAGRGCLEAEIIARNDPFLQEALEMQDFAIDAGPFCAAIHLRDWALVGRLFKRAYEPTTCHLLEGTAVGLAARAGQLDILDRLLARFTDPSVLDSAILPLFINDKDVFLFSNVVNWFHDHFWRRATDHKYYTLGSPLAVAALGEDTSGFEELLRRGCKMDTVTWAVIANSPDSSDYLQVLQEFGCGLGNATEYDEKLGTALCKAITKGKSDLAQYLVKVGANVNEYDVFVRGCTSPLQCAMSEGFIDVAVYLLGKGANINAPPAFEQGATALQFAAIGGHIGLARQLIELGARINVRGSGKLGRSALEGAAEHGRFDMVALLVHHGAITRGLGRQQLINSVAFAQHRAHNAAAEWLKKECGWSDEDQHDLEFVDADADYPVGKCIRAYCCDEYHDNDTQCVYHYTQEEEQGHYDDCERCEEFEDD
ncbi:Sex-determining fem-1 [Fusarium mundagurra]|uniref:Sex-determining fem-1 n=1 Tax=Fusarium mundagurra TaxID=1567541 RepID=A0A8H5YUV3_9HYPO|nr:Sex-determining fem-1 [Fusarium mundagurra]